MEHPFVIALKNQLRQEGSVTFYVSVSPGAHTTAIHDVLENNVIKIRLAKPADKGKANKELIHLIADIFSVPQVHVDIIKGEFGRLKVIRIAGL